MKNFVIFALLILVVFANLAFANDRVAGDFMVVFKPNALVSVFGKDVPDSLLNAMLQFQGEYLKARYGADIRGTFPEITRSSGMGMFHIHSKKAALSDAMFDDVMRKLAGDPEIESVSENRIQRMSIK